MAITSVRQRSHFSLQCLPSPALYSGTRSEVPIHKPPLKSAPPHLVGLPLQQLPHQAPHIPRHPLGQCWQLSLLVTSAFKMGPALAVKGIGEPEDFVGKRAHHPGVGLAVVDHCSGARAGRGHLLGKQQVSNHAAGT